MVKRALVVLTLVAGLGWWYAREQVPGVASAVADASDPASQDAGASQVAGKPGPVRPAGGWSPKAWSVIGGKLVPGHALRDRFDSYLPLGPGVTMVEVRATIERDAQADLGEANATQVLAIWDRYARLQTYDWQHPFDGSDSRGWQSTLNEQHQVRRQLLGVEWAEAFFGEDELAFQRRLAGQVALHQTSKPSLDDVLASAPAVASSSTGASQAVVQVASAASRDDWHARADRARQEWTHLTQDASLDEGQRLIRMRQYLQQNFTGPDAAQVARDLQLP